MSEAVLNVIGMQKKTIKDLHEMLKDHDEAIELLRLVNSPMMRHNMSDAQYDVVNAVAAFLNKLERNSNNNKPK